VQLVSDASRYLNYLIRAIVFALERPTAGAGATVSVYTFFGVICGLSLLLVLVLALRDFSPGSPVFPSPQKPTLANSS